MKRITILSILFFAIVGCEQSTPTLTAEEITVKIDSLTEEMKADVTISEEKVMEITDLYEQYITQFPEDENTPLYLDKQAQYLTSLGKNEKALAAYDNIVQNYPEAENRGAALFMTAFVHAETLNDKDNARTYYEQFLKEYPTHTLAKDAEFSIQTLYMTEDELIEFIINQNKALETDSSLVL